MVCMGPFHPLSPDLFHKAVLTLNDQTSANRQTRQDGVQHLRAHDPVIWESKLERSREALKATQLCDNMARVSKIKHHGLPCKKYTELNSGAVSQGYGEAKEVNLNVLCVPLMRKKLYPDER